MTGTQLVWVTELGGELIMIKLTAVSIERDQQAQRDQIELLLAFVVREEHL